MHHSSHLQVSVLVYAAYGFDKKAQLGLEFADGRTLLFFLPRQPRRDKALAHICELDHGGHDGQGAEGVHG